MATLMGAGLAIGQESMIARSAVVELRRHAPKYLDSQGLIARLLFDNYAGFQIDASPVRYQEAMAVTTDSPGFRASVSGFLCTAIQQQLDDLSDFERDARVFFKLVEPVILEGDYDRLGILFSFEVANTQGPTSWYSDRLKVFTPSPWGVEDVNARFQKVKDSHGDAVIVRRWGPNDEGAQQGNVRLDVDHFRESVDKLDAWNFDLEPELERAKESIREVLHGSA